MTLVVLGAETWVSTALAVTAAALAVVSMAVCCAATAVAAAVTAAVCASARCCCAAALLRYCAAVLSDNVGLLFFRQKFSLPGRHLPFCRGRKAGQKV